MNDTDKTYNGWTNYETWAVALWLDNDEGSHDHWREQALEAWRDDRKNAASNLADQLKAEHEENAPDLPASIYSDLLNAAASEVNWYEIAEHYLDDLSDEDKAQDDDECECEHERDEHDGPCEAEASSGARCACPAFKLQE
jgi:hypothetical protein